MMKIGVTGGVGSGKSLICNIFNHLGIPVFNADDEARILSDSNAEIKAALIALFGKEIYQQQRLNRPLLAEIIFTNQDALEQVNQIIHPRVAISFSNWCQQQSGHLYVIQESAILIESRASRSFDNIITVSSPLNLRIQRVMQRKNMTLDKIKAIMNNQISEEEKIKQSDYTIVNDESILVMPQVLHLHQIFTSIC
jgi:dephospho-CoA kinase